MYPTIESFLAYMQASRGSLPATIATYRDSLTNAADYFVREKGGQTSWTTLVTDDFRAWEAEQMQRGYSASYVKKNMAALRSMYRFLLREGRVAVDPVRLVKNPKQQKRLPTFIRESEMNRLFEYYNFGEGYIGSRNRTIILLLYHTGIRAAELTALNVADIDLDNASLRVTGKGNKQRVIPFGAELKDALGMYMEERKAFISKQTTSALSLEVENETAVAAEAIEMYSAKTRSAAFANRGQGALFLNSRRHRIAYDELRRTVKDALSTVTTQKRRAPHVLRHSFATAMLAHGAQLEAIQQLLGHETVATTAIYTHTTLAELKEQYATAHPRNDDH